MQREVRRKEREISEADAKELLERGVYGVLSTVGADGAPYGVPLNYFVRGGAIYFHCAVEGHKLENLAAEPRVSFCVVGKTEVALEKFSTRYESVIVAGKASEAVADEKQMALEGLLAKYFPKKSEAERLKYIDDLGARTKAFRIDIEGIRGKRN
ncbi:pyridoxamine 5'-phosphate oxidase family protein [Geomonas sp. RF6]|uniref:pyridoxamine 5'-phosphate oxidase family protein n=1 Tax=Geomonas sp. RF6 TaxID=2897342 RepID=UPI001E6555E7|nr:pyridoxamine 5'-phosphate oxidase family protein [Geomonas sp. RF6]UFS69030.1 pyridoxamine 5'-phosphate oxidase family protein [Geomonas sp. RF6]